MQSTRTAPKPLPIHVGIVDDDSGFRDVLSRVVQAAPDMRLAGMAGTRVKGLVMLRDQAANVRLTDLGFPDG